MFSTLKELKEEDAIQVIYHLITLLNKCKNEPDDSIEFERVKFELYEEQELILDNLLEKIDFKNIDDDDELIDSYILELYKVLEEITILKRGLSIERGKERLRKLLDSDSDK